MSSLFLSKNFFKIGLIAAFSPFLFISIYNFPGGFDDINNALFVIKKGEWGAIKFFYENWTGRYTLTILLAYLNPIIYGHWYIGMKISPVITFILFILSVSYLIKSIYKDHKKFNEVLIYSLALLVLYLFSIPSVSEMFYWFSGACTYASGLIFFMIASGGIINTVSAENKFQRAKSIFITLLFLIAAIGTNESLLMGILFLSFVAVVYALYLKSELSYFFMIVFLVTIFASLFSILAPGNSIRSAGMHGEDSVYDLAKLLKAVSHSIYYTSINAIGWLNNFVLILFTALFIPHALFLMNKFTWIQKVTNIHPLISVIITVVFLSVQAFPAYLGMSDVDPRVWNSIYFLFLLSWFFNVVVIINYWNIFFMQFKFNYLYLSRYILVILLLFSGHGNINQAFFDLMLRAPKYGTNLKKRYDLILASKNKDLIVPPVFERIYKYPKTIYTTDISTDKENYKNTSLSEYFQLKSIRLKNEPVI